MADDVIVNKAGSIERCLRRITEEYGGDRRNLFDNQTKQDAIVLNLQRACETAIDLAMYLARIIHEPFCCNRRSAVPTTLRSAGSPLGSSMYCTSTPRALTAPRAGLTTRLGDFATNRHE
ncbi:MAG: hypothetical protein GDA66_06460 [Nitrospira sp. CR1.2]|nr:hypothetical protein [Nitrospira sp. CR1.2]